MSSEQSLGHTELSFHAGLILLVLFTMTVVLRAQVGCPSVHTDARATEAMGLVWGH